MSKKRFLAFFCISLAVITLFVVLGAKSFRSHGDPISEDFLNSINSSHLEWSQLVGGASCDFRREYKEDIPLSILAGPSFAGFCSPVYVSRMDGNLLFLLRGTSSVVVLQHSVQTTEGESIPIPERTLRRMSNIYTLIVRQFSDPENISFVQHVDVNIGAGYTYDGVNDSQIIKELFLRVSETETSEAPKPKAAQD